MVTLWGVELLSTLQAEGWGARAESKQHLVRIRSPAHPGSKLLDEEQGTVLGRAPHRRIHWLHDLPVPEMGVLGPP